ncbi:MAG: hypothetical protein H7177_18055 [Rhizobacter sp.]|nr:hypothetical protein [Bacteriovorax sp.]
MKMLALLFICAIQFGCNYSLSKSPLNFQQTGGGSLEQIPAGTVVSYAVIASSILQPKCIECHSGAGGDAGGINLETYANVTGNLGIIKSEVQSDSMPKNRTKLTAKEKQILFAWIDAGGPQAGTTPTTPTPTKPTDPTLPTDPTTPIQFITYEMVNTQVIKPRCLGCHSDAGGNRGQVNLETYENVAAEINTIETEIKSGSMPRPKNKPLTSEQKDLILKWIANGAPRT